MYDLHMHSTCSDGSDSPKKLLELAKEKGLAGISITDHDTVDAYSDELFTFAKELGLKLITGVEFSTRFRDTNVHLLGYNFDYESDLIQQFCKRHKERRKERNLKILENLAEEGMPISPDQLYQEELTSIGRPHIATLMIEKGYVFSIQEAFNKWIGDEMPCYAPGKSFTVEETIDIIHQAGGKAVLAHPILIKKKNIVKDLSQLPFDGWECHYAKFTFEQSEEMFQIANDRNFIMTGGSDYHGAIKPFNEMGSRYTDEENLSRLLST